MKQCFGYIRVSTQKQGEGVSLDAQRQAIEHFAARNGIVITEWFEEKQTAAKGGRPVFNAMLRALRKRQASGVVIHRVDRSSRNAADWAKIGDLADAGIDVHFASESLDFRSRGGRLSADIQAVIAADYIRNLREETIKGITGRLAQGIYPFRAPIGYVDNGGGKAKTPDPVMAPLVRKAFELYASGRYTIRSLRAEMERRGLRNAWGRPLTKTGIDVMLCNPFYCGTIRIKRHGATYKGIHEPLIPASLFIRVQAVRLGRYAKKITRHNHTYRGLFRCAHCAGAMMPEAHKGHVYYRCQTRGCPTKSVREDRLERSIRETLAAIPLTDRQITRAAEQVAVWFADNDGEDLEKATTLQLAQLGSRLDALTDALIDRLIDNETYNRRKERMMLEQAQLQENLTETRRRRDHPHLVRKFLELTKNLADNYVSAKPAEKREIVEIAISNRLVDGKSLDLKPANWMSETGQAVAVLCGAQERT